ncbi:hypothetical protein T492DRAFT_238897 [Pavlovales sp. CCMP2436]|nr:hypothetical protein T492DRAFT_238897 [Pavlovales sp. CCMP2436]
MLSRRGVAAVPSVELPAPPEIPRKFPGALSNDGDGEDAELLEVDEGGEEDDWSLKIQPPAQTRRALSTPALNAPRRLSPVGLTPGSSLLSKGARPLIRRYFCGYGMQVAICHAQMLYASLLCQTLPSIINLATLFLFHLFLFFATAFLWQLPGFGQVRIGISMLSRKVTQSFSPQSYS